MCLGHPTPRPPKTIILHFISDPAHCLPASIILHLGPALQVSPTLTLLNTARFHQFQALTSASQVSPTLGPSQAAGFTFFGLLGNAPGFTYFEPSQECQVSPTVGPSRVPGFTPSQAPSSTYFRPLASCRLHLFWAPWKRSRLGLLKCQVSPTSGPSQVPGFTYFELQVSPTLGPSQAAGFTSFGPLGSAPGFTYFGSPAPSRVPGPLASSKFHLL